MLPKLRFGALCFYTIGVLITLNPAFAQSRRGRAWYVNVNGSEGNPGSKQHPFKTISEVNKLGLIAGDTIYVHSGQIFEGTLDPYAGLNGAKAKPIVITTYGKGHAVIDGKDSSAIRLYKAGYIKVTHLSLRGSGRKTGNAKDGFALINCKNVQVADLDISGFQKSGLLIYSSQNIVVQKVFVHDNGSAGITVEAPYHSDDEQQMHAWADQYAIGTTMAVKFNPKNPAKVVFGGDANYESGTFLLRLTLFVAIIGVGLLYAAHRQQRGLPMWPRTSSVPAQS